MTDPDAFRASDRLWRSPDGHFYLMYEGDRLRLVHDGQLSASFSVLDVGSLKELSAVALKHLCAVDGSATTLFDSAQTISDWDRMFDHPEDQS